MKEFLIVSATQRSYSEFWDDTKLGKSLTYFMQMGTNFDVEVYSKNKMGLGELYHNILRDEFNLKESSKYKYVIFAHDDLFIHSINMFDLLIERFDQGYGLIGLAGSSQIPNTKGLISWHNTNQTSWSGVVAHPNTEGVDEYRTNSFGAYPRKVVTLDGLFMAVSLEILNGVNLFDPQFTFDFYDMDACFTAMSNGIRMSTVGIYTEHASHGDGILDKRYLEFQDKFKHKWLNKQENSNA
jgi:hypothetical protein